LIRSESDRGVLMICDTRLADKPYGKLLLNALPAMTRTRKLEVVARFFAAMPVARADAQAMVEQEA
jgi:ATP-dependent DNA helicase DinG